MRSGRQAVRRLLLAGMVAVSAAMVGCGTVQHVADVPGKAELSADKAVVLLSVTSNSPRSGQFDSVVLERVASDGGRTERYLLNQLSKGLARDTALFVGAVPPGSYRVARFNVGTLYLEINEIGRERIGRLDVMAGASHDLGRLVVTNLNSGILVGRSKLVTSNADLVKRFVPDAARYAEKVTGSGWAGPRHEKDRAEELALSMPAGASALTELSTGEVVAASRVGSILVRSTLGKWRRIGIDSLESLLWLKPVDDPKIRLVAVGEFNTIVQVQADWTTQRLNPGNLPPGNLLFIDGSPAAGWFIAQIRGQQVTIYRSASLDAGDWQAVKTADVGVSFWSGAESFWAWPTSEGFAYALSSGQINWFNFKTGAWTQNLAPEGRRIIAVQPNPNDALGVLTSPGGGLGGVFAGVHVSTDKGATWQTVASPYKVNAKPPVMMPSGALLMQGSAFSDKELQRSEGLSGPWTKMPGNVYISEWLMALPTKGLFAIDDGSTPSGYASIRHSVDEGRTWWVEYSNYIDFSKK